MRVVILAVICVAAFTLGTCKPKPPMGLSQIMSDSLEYYFKVANEDTAAISMRKRCAERAWAIIETMPKDSIYIKNMFRVANRYWNMGEVDSYQKTNNLIIGELESDMSTNKCKALLYIGDFLFAQGKKVEAYKSYHESEMLARNLKNSDYLLKSLLKKAALLVRSSDFQRCEETVYKGLKIASARNKSYLHRFYNFLGIISNDLKEYDEALISYNKAIDALRTYGEKVDQGLEGAYIYNICLVLLEQKKLKAADEICKKGLALKTLPKFSDNYISLLEIENVISYEINGNYSIKTSDAVIKASFQLSDYSGAIACMVQQAEYYWRNHEYIVSREKLDSALILSRGKRLPTRELECLKAYVDFGIEGDFAKDYIKTSDSIQLVNRRFRGKFSQIEYETEELKQQNASLLTNNQKLSVGGSAIALTLASGLLLRHYRAKKKELKYVLDQQKANDEIYHLLQQQQQKVEEGRRLEKQRISQELHDGVMGKLSGIRLNLFILNKRTDPEAIAHCIQNINKIQEVEKEIRTIAYDLDSKLFEDDHSFATLLQGIIESIESHSETRFQLLLDPSIDWNDIPNTRKMQLYRVLQEALTNVDKYAHATQGIVSIKGWDSKLSVIVSDDGIGFSASQAHSGLGLKNMESRIKNEGGSFKLKSVLGRGTRIIFTLPFAT